MKIFDCFTFFNEVELLEFRLKLLYDHVDHFVLAESDTTHAGQPKPLYFEENRQRFAPWIDKIIHLKIHQSTEGLVFNKETTYNPTAAAWRLENDQRNALGKIASQVADDDLVLVSDLDEIPDPSKSKKINTSKGPVALAVLFHYYFLNCQLTERDRWWNGPVACSGKDFKATTPQALRDKRNDWPLMKKAGWHFSFLGGAERIKQKIRSFAHTEFNKEEFLDDKNIMTAMEEGKDIFKRPGIYHAFVSLYYYPEFLRKIMLQYPTLLHQTNKDNFWNKLIYGVKKWFR